MNRIIIISFSILSLFFLGCASVSKAPTNKSEEAKSFQVSTDKGTVYLYRTGRAVGAAGQLQVTINNHAAGGTGPGSFFKWDFMPGIYTFSSSTGESSAVIQLEIKAGEVYYLRQDARMGVSTGRVTLKEVSVQKGQKEIMDCKLLVSSYVPE